MDEKDAKVIRNLAKEGKKISEIMKQDFPQYPYWEIYGAVYDEGGKSALGVKRTIANRLKTLVETSRKQERSEIIDEIEDLVWHLYESLKSSQKKLDSMRKILNK